jgi:hypothetical protein
MAGPFNVVVVPGFAGTTLSYRGGRTGKTQLWYNPLALLTGGPLAGALAADGVSPYPVFGRQLFVDGPVDLGIYEPLLTALANAGFQAVFWGYDWRMSAAGNAAKLATYLLSATLASPFQVVAHSGGGLVAQAAYPIYNANPGAPTWQQTVYAGTPHGGCYWSAAALAGWFPGGSELATLAGIWKLTTPFPPSPKQTVYDAIQTAVGLLVGSWPGLYALLPSSQGPWALTDPNAAALATLATYAQTAGGQQTQWFSAAYGFQTTLVNNLTQPRPRETCVVNQDFSTPFAYNGGTANPGYLPSYANGAGDGTVPINRATLPNGSPVIYCGGISHQALVTSYAGTQAIIGALQTSPSGNETIQFAGPPQAPNGPQPAAPTAPAVPYPFNNLHSDP